MGNQLRSQKPILPSSFPTPPKGWSEWDLQLNSLFWKFRKIQPKERLCHSI